LQRARCAPPLNRQSLGNVDRRALVARTPGSRSLGSHGRCNVTPWSRSSASG